MTEKEQEIINDYETCKLWAEIKGYKLDFVNDINGNNKIMIVKEKYHSSHVLISLDNIHDVKIFIVGYNTGNSLPRI